MKKGIHPKYYSDCQVTCACGNSFTTGSTKQTIQVEICAACHPFFTGKMKYVDTMGRVEKFQKAQAKANKVKSKTKKKQARLKNKQATPTTLKEMIQKQQKKSAV